MAGEDKGFMDGNLKMIVSRCYLTLEGIPKGREEWTSPLKSRLHAIRAMFLSLLLAKAHAATFSSEG